MGQRQLKIPEYVIKDTELREFVDKVRELLNYGKYQYSVTTSLPGWVGLTGEQVLYRPTSGGTTQYVYLGTAWISTWSISI